MCRGPPSPPPAHDATGRGDTPLLLLHGKKHDFPSSWHVRGFPILAPLFSSPPPPFYMDQPTRNKRNLSSLSSRAAEAAEKREERGDP